MNLEKAVKLLIKAQIHILTYLWVCRSVDAVSLERGDKGGHEGWKMRELIKELKNELES